MPVCVCKFCVLNKLQNRDKTYPWCYNSRAMETKKHNYSYIIKTILFIALVILVGATAVFGRLLGKSLQWLHEAWSDVSFTTALFQMKTPLAGVNTDEVDEYIRAAVVPTILLCGIPLTVNLFIAIFLKVRHLSIPIATRKKEKALDYKFTCLYGALLVMLVSWVDVPAMAGATGADEYVENIFRGDSTFYQDYYADPEKTALTFPEKKRNLVMIYMESMETTYADTAEGGGKATNLIPNLTELALSNVSFSNNEKLGGCTATEGTTWTMAAMLASTSGVPYAVPVEGNSMDQYSTFLPKLVALGDILEENGYRNYFCCGSDATFGGRKLCLSDHGDYTFYDWLYAKRKGYIPKDYSYGWGMEDIKTIAMAKKELSKLAESGEPFNFTFLTQDTHHPVGWTCDECEPMPGEARYSTCIRCSDKQVTKFVEWMEEQPWYENTTVILLGDHCSMATDFWDDLPDDYERHVYNCFLNLPEGLSPVNEKDRLFSTEDYFPTILTALGVQIDGDRLGLGTNLFSDKETVLEQIGLEQYNIEVSGNTAYYVSHFE